MQKNCGSYTQSVSLRRVVPVQDNTFMFQINTKTVLQERVELLSLAQDLACPQLSAFTTVQSPCTDKRIENQAWKAHEFIRESHVSLKFQLFLFFSFIPLLIFVFKLCRNSNYLEYPKLEIQYSQQSDETLN